MYQGPLGLLDPGDGGHIAPNAYGQICEMATAGAETRTLGTPTKAGIRFHLRVATYVGDAVVTCDATVNVAGNNTMTFEQVGDGVDLISVTDAGALRWDILENIGAVALSTV